MKLETESGRNRGIALLTPIDIHNKEFKRSFRGYNEDEIDDFLDQVVNDYEHLFRENEKLKEELEQSKKRVEQYTTLEDSIKDSLTLAQKTATEYTAHAKQEADTMRENAAKECQNLRRAAEMQAQKRIAESKENVRAIVAEYERLVQEKNQFLRRMQTMLEGELADVKDTLSAMPDAETRKAEKDSVKSLLEDEELPAADSETKAENADFAGSGHAEGQEG